MQLQSLWLFGDATYQSKFCCDCASGLVISQAVAQYQACHKSETVHDHVDAPDDLSHHPCLHPTSITTWSRHCVIWPQCIYQSKRAVQASDFDLLVCFAARDTAAKLLGITVTAMQQSTAEDFLVDLSNKFPTAAKAADSKLTYESQHGALAAVGCILAQCQSGAPPATPFCCCLCSYAYKPRGLVVLRMIVWRGRQLRLSLM